MKKLLLSAVALVAAMSANAQTEYAVVDATTFLESLEKTTFTDSKGNVSDAYQAVGGDVMCQSASVTMKVAYEEPIKSSALSGKDDAMKAIVIGDVAYAAPAGVTGNNNPGGTTLADGASSAASSGMVFRFDVTKDGYLYVFGKLSTNKPYYVWEGLSGQGEMPVAYTLAMYPLSKMDPFEYTLPADEYGYFDFTAADADKYYDGAAYRWPEKAVLGTDAEDVKVNGLGVIKFPVYAEAGHYLVHATGSKMTADGFVFSTEDLSIGFAAEAAGIKGVKATDAQSAVRYNLAGQKVDASYKGLVIMNGKKAIVK